MPIDLARVAADDPQHAISAIVDVLDPSPDRWQQVDAAVAAIPHDALLTMLKELTPVTGKPAPRGTRLWLAARILQLVDRSDEAVELLRTSLQPGGELRKLRKKDGPAGVVLAEHLCTQFAWEEAYQLCVAIRLTKFRHPRLWSTLATAAEAENRMSEAAEAWRDAAADSPRDVAPRLRLAELLNRERDPNAAVAVYTAIVQELDATNNEALEGMIRGMLAGGALPAAKEALQTAERAGAKGPTMERMKALMEVMTSGQPPNERIESYCRELSRILSFSPEDKVTLLDLAYSEANRGMPADALRRVDKLLELEPRHIPARELRVELFTAMLRQSEAKAALQLLIKERPHYLRWRRRLADLAVDMVDPETAEEQIRYVLDRIPPTDPQRLELTALLLDVLDGAGRLPDALELARRVYDDGPDDPARRLVLLNMLQHAERHHEAAQVAAQWHRATPNVLDWQEHFAMALVRDQRGELARLHIVGWMEDRPDEPRLVRLLHRVLVATQREQEAIQLARGGGVTGAGLDAGRLLEALIAADQRDEALELAKSVEAARRTGPNGSLVIDLALRFDRLDDAERMLNESIDNDRRRLAAGQRVDVADLISRMQTLASVCQRTGRAARGEQLLRDALQMAPRDAGLNNDLGYTWAEMEWNLDKAEEMIRLAVARHPREPSYLDSLAWVRYKQGDFDDAVEWMRRAVRWRKADPTLLDHYGDALFRAGEPKEALKRWEAAVEAGKSPDRKHRSEEDAEVLTRAAEKVAAMKAGEKPAVSPAPRKSKPNDSDGGAAP